MTVEGLKCPECLVRELRIDVHVGAVEQVFRFETHLHKSAVFGIRNIPAFLTVFSIRDEIPRTVFTVDDIGVLVDAFGAQFVKKLFGFLDVSMIGEEI